LNITTKHSETALYLIFSVLMIMSLASSACRHLSNNYSSHFSAFVHIMHIYTWNISSNFPPC